MVVCKHMMTTPLMTLCLQCMNREPGEDSQTTTTYEVNVCMNCCNLTCRHDFTDANVKDGQKTEKDLLQSKKPSRLWKHSQSRKSERVRKKDCGEMAAVTTNLHPTQTEATSL